MNEAERQYIREIVSQKPSEAAEIMAGIRAELELQQATGRIPAQSPAPAPPTYTLKQTQVIRESQADVDFDAEIEFQNLHLRPKAGEPEAAFLQRAKDERNEIHQRLAGARAEQLLSRVEFGGEVGQEQARLDLAVDSALEDAEYFKDLHSPGASDFQAERSTVSELYSRDERRPGFFASK